MAYGRKKPTDVNFPLLDLHSATLSQAKCPTISFLTNIRLSFPTSLFLLFYFSPSPHLYQNPFRVHHIHNTSFFCHFKFRFVLFKFNVNSMLCFSKNNTESVSVAPVRYPVVQISFKLHILNKRGWASEGGGKEAEEQGRRKRVEHACRLPYHLQC